MSANKYILYVSLMVTIFMSANKYILYVSLMVTIFMSAGGVPRLARRGG